MSIMKKATEVMELSGLQTQAVAKAMGLGIRKEAWLKETAETWDALEKTLAAAAAAALVGSAEKKAAQS